MMENSVSSERGPPGQGGRDKKGAGKRSKKATPMKDPNAPKRPKTAYFLYCQENWQKIRTENPDMSFSDVGRQVGSSWNMLPTEDKTRFIEAAEKDRERYVKEFTAYQETEAYRDFMESKRKAKVEQSRRDTQMASPRAQGKQPSEPSPTPPPPTFTKPTPLSSQQGFVPGTDIPVFSQQFLEHNRVMESELRKLRLANIDLEEENALLSRHVDNMKSSASKLKSDITTQRSRNSTIREHLDILRTALVAAFKEVPLPGSGETPTLDTIDSYIGKLQVAVSEDRELHSELVAKMREVARQLEGEWQAEEEMETEQTENGAVS